MSIKYRKTVYIILPVLVVLFVIAFALNNGIIRAKSSDECFACHEDKDLTYEKNGRKTSLFVDPALYKKSSHGGFDCKDCHEGYNPEEIPHSKSKAEINCKNCHDNVKGLENSVHKSGNCYGCHNPHYQAPMKGRKSDPSMCLTCHSNKNVKEYSASVHAGKNIGCDGCHKGGHEVKNISRQEISNTCGKCHGSHQNDFNNSVHQTVMRKGNQKSPTCVDCHGAHKIISSKMTIESQACLKCHLDEKLFPGEEKGSAKFVARYKTSIHSSIQKDGKPAAGCIDCHGDHMIESLKDPSSSTARAKMMQTCGKCHTKEVDHFGNSAHGTAFKNGDPNAPECSKCHGEHDINSVLISDEFSKINQTEMCLTCHKDDKVNKKKDTHLNDYKNSFHYIALKNGDTKAATCSNCHGPHEMRPSEDTLSQIHKKNIENTCGQADCHVSQKEEFTGSIHQVGIHTKENSDSPTCNTCHGAHQVASIDTVGNRQGTIQKGIVKLCSSCHASVELIKNNDLPNVVGNYRESFHGLAVRGGSGRAASCGSCHGNHNIRPSGDSLSTIHKNNLGKTCGKCHPGADNVFINTKIHVLESKTDNPVLFWITNFYIFLIVATIGGMVLHNILDFRRKIKDKKAGH